jgi:hypothetical protein
MGGARQLRGGVRFACQGCGGCCRGPGGYVFLGQGEAEEIARHLGLPVHLFLEAFTRRAEGRTALVDAASGDCWFLGDTGCAVYPARPRQCRTWPFWFANVRSDRDWEEAMRTCPGIGRGDLLPPGEIARRLEES